MTKYIIRAVKYFFYIGIIFSLLVTIMFYTSEVPEGTTVLDLFKEGAWWKILLFFVVFYSNGNWNEKKKEIKAIFENANFVLKEETPTSMTFILRNKVLRFIRYYEDAIVLDYSNEPATISGLRKDTLRFSRSIERLMRMDAE